MEIMPLGELKSLNELLEVMQHIVQHSSLQGELCRALEEHLSALSASFHSLFHHFFLRLRRLRCCCGQLRRHHRQTALPVGPCKGHSEGEMNGITFEMTFEMTFLHSLPHSSEGASCSDSLGVQSSRPCSRPRSATGPRRNGEDCE